MGYYLDMETTPAKETTMPTAPYTMTPAEQQRFQVHHYLRLWETYPTSDNWTRVIEAAEAYAPAKLVAGSYFKTARHAGRAGMTPALGRIARIGRQGKVYTQTFRKGARTWTKAR